MRIFVRQEALVSPRFVDYDDGNVLTQVDSTGCNALTAVKRSLITQACISIHT